MVTLPVSVVLAIASVSMTLVAASVAYLGIILGHALKARVRAKALLVSALVGVIAVGLFAAVSLLAFVWLLNGSHSLAGSLISETHTGQGQSLLTLLGFGFLSLVISLGFTGLTASIPDESPPRGEPL
jgi:hypothetical protein